MWAAPAIDRPISARVSLPGSKSLTNRFLVLGAIGDEPLRIHYPLSARDTTLMAQALTNLGVQVTQETDCWTVHPAPLHGGTVDAGLAGNVMRFVTALAANADGVVHMDGDEHARVRPMGALVTALSELGVKVESGDYKGQPVLPLTIHGTGPIAGGVLTIDASASSQFVSALLLAAPLMKSSLDLRHVGPAIPSAPHIAMTVSLLREAGIVVDEYCSSRHASPDRWVVHPGHSLLRDVTVEPDLSNAGPFLAAAMITGGSVSIERWPAQTTQAGDSFRTLLDRMGGDVRLADGLLTVTGPEKILPLDADLHDVGELVPTLAAMCAFAAGTSALRNIGQLRGHETDRLAALVAELSKIGVPARIDGDDLIISPTGVAHPAELSSYADHRMATFAAVVGLRLPGTSVDDIATTSKTMPQFARLWNEMISHE